MCHSIILKHQVPLAWAAGTMAPTKGSAGGCEGDSGPEKLQPSSAHLAQTLLNSLYAHALPLGCSSAILLLLSTGIPSCYTSLGSLCVH